MFEDLQNFGVIIFLLIIWSAVWKGIALWKAGNRKQLGWFIAMFILNTAGILPIIYLLLNKEENQNTMSQPQA